MILELHRKKSNRKGKLDQKWINVPSNLGSTMTSWGLKAETREVPRLMGMRSQLIEWKLGYKRIEYRNKRKSINQ